MVRIMVVDDEKKILEEIEEELLEQGWEVDAFDNSNKAFEALREKSYTIGVFDIIMPKMMNGVTLLEKAQAWQHDMDVILMTGRPELDTAIRAVQLGACDYLHRPFELSELVRVINRALTHRSLRLDNAVLTNRLKTLEVIAGGIQISQTLTKILNDTLGHIASTISQDHQYAAFIADDHFDQVIVSYGVDAQQIGLVKETLPIVKDWIRQESKNAFRISDITLDAQCPLDLGDRNELLFAPVFHKQQLMGALLCTASGKDVFSPYDEIFLMTTANLIGHVVNGVITQDKLSKAEDLLRNQQTAECCGLIYTDTALRVI